MADTIPADNSASSPETVGPRALLPASTATAASAPAASAAPAEPSTPPPPMQAPSRSGGVRSVHLLVLLIVFAVTGVGSLMLLASAMQPPAGHTATAEVAVSQQGGGPAPATSPAVAPTTAVQTPVETPNRPDSPRWQASTNSRKAGYGANIVFELAADEDVEVWRKRTRPVLTMRCAARTTEVFVVTNSPATIEGNSNRHTVKVAFDGREPVEQIWEHSIDHDALFAPDGGAMMRKVTAAKSMSFTFAPFNAPPATVTFSVAGFDEHRKAAAAKCRM